MESTSGDGWWNELKKYWCKIEDQTKLSLQLIKRDRIRRGLLFDEKFKNNFLRTTYTKIGDTFEQFVKDEHCVEQFSSDIDIYIDQQDQDTQASEGSQRDQDVTQQAKEIDQNERQPLTNGTTRMDVSKQLAIIVPHKQRANNGHHIQPIALSSNTENTAINFHNPLNGPNVAAVEDFRQADKVRSAEHGLKKAQDVEIIDLISDQEEEEETVSHHVSCTTRDIENVAGPSQLVTKPQKTVTNNTSVSLKNNLKSSNADTKKPFQCDYFVYSTNKKSHLNQHIRTHTGERPYACPICKNRFTRNNDLARHMKIHRAMFAFHCPNCHQGFSDKKLRESHENRCKAKGYECHLCKRDFIRKDYLVQHMRKHTGEKLRCSKCQKQFSSKMGLTQHMKMHGKLFPFQCLNCRQVFSCKKLWETHESRCKSKQYECYLCSKKNFQHKQHLLHHMRIHHTGEKPFGCTDCRERFYVKSDLTKHMKCRH